MLSDYQKKINSSEELVKTPKLETVDDTFVIILDDGDEDNNDISDK